ncbi:MAG: hypothetical protein IJU23_11155 [Proteobacteria bacterium]|nr:hypothetical protein [Pseudomonadota bacterium]
MMLEEEKSKFWAYVTAFGTLWGGLELTLGTFLHVLRVPKTGLIMTLLCVVLLLAQRQVFPKRGSTICVGIVAACIKCLSPGGIILGPVFGILSEALVVELCLLASSRNVVTCMMAGGLTLVLSQLQSVIKMWFYYGQDFIDGIIKTVSKFFAVSWSPSLGWQLLGAFFAVVFVAGAVAGFVGRRLGNRVEKELLVIENTEDCTEITAGNPTNDGSERTSLDTNQTLDAISKLHKNKKRISEPDAQILKTRKFMWIFALVTLVAQFSGDLLWSSVALGVWLVALALWARRVIRAIWWPKFWALTLAVSIVCGLVLAWNQDGSWNWMLGLEATARMIVRGIYVFSLVSWLARCFQTQEFLNIWKKIHLPGMGESLVAAYSLLPEWLDRMNELVSARPKGFMNNIRYIRQCMLTCLVDAARSVK